MERRTYIHTLLLAGSLAFLGGLSHASGGPRALMQAAAGGYAGSHTPHELLNLVRELHRKVDSIAKQVQSGGNLEGATSEPYTNPKSAFVNAHQLVQIPGGRKLSVDEILYGYDLIFEANRLFLGQSWLGVQSQQDPADAWTLQQLIWDIKPKVIVDIGTNVGGSAIFFASIMNYYLEPGQGIIVSCDPKHYSVNVEKDGAARACPKCTSGDVSPLWRKWVEYHQASSLDDEVFNAIEAAIKKYGGPVLVSVDGNHDGQVVLQELRKYHKYVSTGSYMVVQDTKLDRLFAPNYKGPLWAIQQWLQEEDGKKFTPDRKREMFWYSQHATGYLFKSPALNPVS